MQSKDLEAYLAIRTSRSASNLDQIGRSLRNAGLLPAGSRGKGAPHLKPVDVANFLIAVAMARTASEASEIAQLYGNLVSTRSVKDFPGHDKPIKRITFGDALTTLLTEWGAMSRVIEIKFERWPKHQDMLYTAAADISWTLSKPTHPDFKHTAMQFEPFGSGRNEKIVTHNQTRNTLMLEETTLGGDLLKGLASMSRL